MPLDTPKPAPAEAVFVERNRRLDALVRRRARIEYIAGGFAIAVLLLASAGLLFSSRPEPLEFVVLAGQLALVAGLASVLWNVWKHGRKLRRAVFSVSPRQALAARLRGERDFLSRVWAWYLAPLVPGFALLWGGMIARDATWVAIGGAVATLALLLWIWRANRNAAEKYDRQLEALEVGA